MFTTLNFPRLIYQYSQNVTQLHNNSLSRFFQISFRALNFFCCLCFVFTIKTKLFLFTVSLSFFRVLIFCSKSNEISLSYCDFDEIVRFFQPDLLSKSANRLTAMRGKTSKRFDKKKLFAHFQWNCAFQTIKNQINSQKLQENWNSRENSAQKASLFINYL